MASTVHSNGLNSSAVKGHLVTKSSALSCTSSKLEAQFITAQHMASHYKRVINAKSAINTLPPKSITCSQKARDRARREMNSYSIARQSASRTRSADASPRNSISVTDNSAVKTSSLIKQQHASPGMKAIVYRDTINRNIIVHEIAEPKPLPDQQKLNKSMSNLMAGFTKTKQSTGIFVPDSPRTTLATGTATEPANMFARKFDFMNTDKTKAAMASLLFNANANPHASVVDSYESPALKAMSRLVAGRHYDVLDNHADKFTHPTKTFQPRIKNTNTTSSLAQKSSYYQPPRRRRKNTGDNNSRPVSAMGSGVSVRPQSNEEKPVQEIEDVSDLEAENPNVSQSKVKDSSPSRKSSLRKSSVDIQQQLKKEAEKDLELKYLEFIKEVTNDVIARGISSARVINTCFEYHLNKHRDTLDEQKMLELLDTLRADIGISADSTSLKTLETKKNYSTLEKLGYSSSPDSAKRRTSPASVHEDQIVKNIESIRRRSLSSKSSSSSNNNTNHSNTNENKENTRPADDAKGRGLSQGSEQSSDSTESNRKASILKKTSFSEVRNQVPNDEDDDDDDDDDDVFTGNNGNKGVAVSKVSNDDMFNDDYGDESEDEETGELKTTDNKDKNDIEDEDEEEDDDDDFDSMLKTRTFSNSRSKLASATNKSNFDDESNRISRETARATTPRPVPRKPNVPFKHDNVSGGSETSDDDAY